MKGRQEEIYEEIMDIAGKILEGMYGKGDDVDETAIRDDLSIIAREVM